jgi:hypothetical protein
MLNWRALDGQECGIHGQIPKKATILRIRQIPKLVEGGLKLRGGAIGEYVIDSCMIRSADHLETIYKLAIISLGGSHALSSVESKHS